MPGNALVQSVLRGLDLVRLLAESDGGMTLSEIVSVTGLKRPTCSNLLRTLVSRDFVANDGGVYRIGPALHILAARDSSSAMLVKALKAVQLLKERLPSCVISFCEPVGGEAITRFRYTPGELLIERNCNAILPPYQSASGLGMLAYGSPEFRQLVQQRYPFEWHGLSVWETENSLESFLEEVRVKGHILPPFCKGRRFTLVGVPVFWAGGKFSGILGAAWHCSDGIVEKETQNILQGLREAAGC